MEEGKPEDVFQSISEVTDEKMDGEKRTERDREIEREVELVELIKCGVKMKLEM